MNMDEVYLQTYVQNYLKASNSFSLRLVNKHVPKNVDVYFRLH